MSEQPKDIGRIIKTERENKGFSLDMVHEATKIPIDSLKAIEEGYKVRTLTAFYYKSFVRIYAQFLNLDPEPLLAQISSHSSHSPNSPKKNIVSSRPVSVSKKMSETMSLNLFTKPLRSRKSRTVLKIVAAVAVVAVVVFLLVGLVRKIRSSMPAPSASVVKVEKKAVKKEPVLSGTIKKTEERKKPEPVKSVEIVKPLPPSKSVEANKPVPVAKTNEAAKPVEAVKKVEPIKVPESKPAPAETKAASQTEPKQNVAAAKTPRKVTVTVRAVNSSFLTVRADGTPVFQGTLKKGASETWNAAKTIDISGKDIDQLEFEVNGKPTGRLGRRGAPVKKIRVTPEGLTVEK